MKIKKLKLIKYADPQHGWLKVKRKLIESLGIADEITPYSYQRKGWVYLEEDQDVGTFIKGLARHNGFELTTVDGHQATVKLLLDVKYKHTNNSSSIRNYEHYNKQGENNGN